MPQSDTTASDGARRRVAVVTGATSGIGREIALGLARAGLQVVAIGRDPGRGRALQDDIEAEVPGASVEFERADLSLLAQTRAAAERIAARHPAIALLVNNAGVFEARRVVTAEGHERVLATNLLSPWALTQALLPALKRGASARVVNVGSSSSDRARLDPERLSLGGRWGMVQVYAQSKLALMMVSFALARELEGAGVTVNVVHPGLVASGIVREGGAIGLAWKLIGRFALTNAQGADTPLHVALSPEVEGVTGAYFKRCRAVRPNALALDRRLVARVRAETERLAGSPPPTVG